MSLEFKREVFPQPLPEQGNLYRLSDVLASHIQDKAARTQQAEQERLQTIKEHRLRRARRQLATLQSPEPKPPVIDMARQPLTDDQIRKHKRRAEAYAYATMVKKGLLRERSAHTHQHNAPLRDLQSPASLEQPSVPTISGKLSQTLKAPLQRFVSVLSKRQA
jgi:hypothetical protein